MVGKGYYKRIAASKASLDLELEELAEANPHLNSDEFKELAREKFSCTITENYAEDLVARFSSAGTMKR